MANGYWNPRTELMPREQLERLQLKKLQALVNWAYRRSPFWQHKLDLAGVKPQDINCLADIRSIPFLTREELNRSQSEHPVYGDILSVPPAKAVRYHQTSGSSGKVPLRILDGWKDWEWIAEMWCYGMYAFGVRETDIVYLAYNYGTFIGFWGAHYASEKIGALTIPSGGLSSEERVRKIIELGATVLVCTPTYALRLAQVADELGINLARESQVRLLIHAGEPGANIPATKKLIEEAWGAKAGDFPGMSETGGSTSFECAAQPGGVHILEDHYLQEVINPDTGETLGYGQKGELVLTSFGRATIPLLRYRTGDLVERVENTNCPCGRSFDLYRGGILGRADDMKLVRGVNVFPGTLENIIREFREADEFQIILFKEKGIDQIMVKIEPVPEMDAGAYEELRDKLAEALNQAHRLKFIVEIVEPGTLPKFELKARRLLDIRDREDTGLSQTG